MTPQLKPHTKRAPGGPSGGFLFRYALPPFAVVILGIALACFLSQVTSTTTRSQPISPAPGKSKIAPLFTPEVQHWEAKIISWSRQWGLDPNLVATVMQIESCGDPKALSSAGAIGLFQVMPYHFQPEEDPFKPRTNALRGLSYLRSALEAGGGDIRLAFAGYNGGIHGAKRPESSWAAETLRYVYWGTGIYKDARKMAQHSDRLEEWLAAGGASLCAQAASRLGLDS